MKTCDVCANAAAVHETLIESGRVTRRHLCREHGRALWFDAAAAAEPRLRDAPQSAWDELRRLLGRAH